jgi:hypothetical protein
MKQHSVIKNHLFAAEHVFAAIEQLGGKMIRMIGPAHANFAMTMMAACDNLGRLVYFRKYGKHRLLMRGMGRIAASPGNSRQNSV